jgi:hypothetical protein
MAVTKIKAIKSTVNKAIDYITNPRKTDGKLLVSGFKVEPPFAAIEYKMTAELAKELKGDYTNTGKGNNLAYHTIQSFAKFDKITPEEAHELGKKLADEMLQEKHEYVIATHIDKGHIHNHIIFNAISFEDFKKFRSEPYKTAAKLREISDRLCEEKGLYVVKEHNGKGKGHREWQETKNGTSWKAQIQAAIDKAVPQATDYNSFVELMKQAKIEIKEGKHIAFKLEGQQQQRFVRGKTIGENYTKEGLDEAIKNKTKTQEQPSKGKNNARLKGDLHNPKKVQFTLDKRVAYETRKQQITATKELANMLVLLRRETISKLSDFEIRIDTLKGQSRVIKGDMKLLVNKNAQYKEAAKYLLSYHQYLPINQQHDQQTIFTKKQFYNQHQSELLAYEHALKQLEKMSINTNVDPEKIVELVKQQTSQISELQAQYKQTDSRIDELKKAQEMVQTIIKPQQEEPQKDTKKEREER